MKCTKIYNARAQLLFCSLNLLFSDVLVAVVVVVCLSSLIAVHVRYKSLYISLPSSANQEREMTNFCVVY